MLKYQKVIYATFFTLLTLVVLVQAQGCWTPTGNICLKNFYSIINAKNVNITNNLTVNSTGIVTFEVLSAANCDVKSWLNGTIYCGTDSVGAGGYWQVVANWMSGNETAGGTQNINMSAVNTTTLNVSGTATMNEANMTTANVVGNMTSAGVHTKEIRRNSTINSTFYINENGTFVFHAELV